MPTAAQVYRSCEWHLPCANSNEEIPIHPSTYLPIPVSDPRLAWYAVQ